MYEYEHALPIRRKINKYRDYTYVAGQVTNTAVHELSSYSSTLLRTCCSERHTSAQDWSIECSYMFPHTHHYVRAGLESQHCPDDVKVSQKRGAVLFELWGPPDDTSTMEALLNAI